MTLTFDKLLPFLKGFSLGASLIIAIGAQNAFVLRQGLKKNHVFITAFLCSLIDALLITVGVGGFGTLVATNHFLLSAARWGGAAFLIFYGVRSFWKALKPATLDVEDSFAAVSLKSTILALFAFSFLNPHVYLDTVVLIGSLGAQFLMPERIFFAIGAAAASFVWFFSLCYGARILLPIFRKPASWRVLDIVIGTVMFLIAGSLMIRD